jgi:serine protein kinase
MERLPHLRAEGGRRDRPVFESPLGLFDPETHGPIWRRSYGIPRAASRAHEPWAVKRLDEFGGDISRFKVVRMYPSKLRQIASPRPSRATRTTRTSPRWSARSTSASSRCYSQNDPDAYSYSGGLNRANQGMLEFVEMFKAPIKMLHPLLTATQEATTSAPRTSAPSPSRGIIMAHSNEAEWQTFRNNKNNEAFLDRIYGHQGAVLPARHRGAAIYDKLLRTASWRGALRARHAEMLARSRCCRG